MDEKSTSSAHDKACSHERLTVSAEVTQLTDAKTEEPINVKAIKLTVECAVCGCGFHFLAPEKLPNTSMTVPFTGAFVVPEQERPDCSATDALTWAMQNWQVEAAEFTPLPTRN